MRRSGSCGNIPHWEILPDPARSADPRAVAAACAPFAALPQQTAGVLLKRMREQAWTPGQTIVRQGERGDALLFVVAGTARSETRDPAGRVSPAGAVAAGDLVGAMSLLSSQAHAADVVAETDVSALVLPAKDFEEIARAYPELGSVLTHVLVQRLRDDGAARTVDRYRILRTIGKGAASVVYEGEEVGSGRRVALRMLNHRLIFDTAALARFQREADVLESVAHPNVARVFRRFHAFRTYFIAMELCLGPTLAEHLAASGPAGDAGARSLVRQLGGALLALHRRGVAHRDLRPSNVVATAGGVLKLCDFGLAKPVVGTPTSGVADPRTLLARALYMAPEALAGDDLGPESDVYALGCIVLEALTGRSPFPQADFVDLLAAKRAFEVPSAAQLGCSPETHAFLTAALSSDAHRRKVVLAAVSQWCG